MSERCLACGKGMMIVRMGKGLSLKTLRLWVDANQPVVVMETESVSPCTATAMLELWRTKRTRLKEVEVMAEIPGGANRAHGAGRICPLHAPHRTVVQGRVEQGKLVSLKVTPAARIKDVKTLKVQ